VLTIAVKLRDRPLAPAVRRRAPPEADVRPVAQAASPLGLTVRELDAATAERLRIPDIMQGVLVSDIDPAGPARFAQIRTNQVVLEVNRRRVGSVGEFRAAVASLRAGETAALLLYDRNSRQRTIVTVVPDLDP
jgi:serine protease Do